MSQSTVSQAVFRVADLPTGKPTAFLLVPDVRTLAALAQHLDLAALRKLRFQGEIQPQGAQDWRIVAHLGATLVQPCVATLEPVTTRIETDVTRVYLAQFSEPEGAEVEMDADDTIEPLPTEFDLIAIMTEALALNIPLYPRIADATPVQSSVTEPGVTPLSDDDVRPFSSLASLRDKLQGKD